VTAPRHQCARPGCTNTVPTYMYACRVCWFTLPSAIRSAINEGWVVRKRMNNPLPHRQATARAQQHWAREDQEAGNL
jgi:hypothetical protein